MSDWETLDKIEQGVDALVEKARVLRQPRPAKARELSVLFVQEVGFIQPLDYRLQSGTFYNGDERDLVVHRLTAMVYFSDAAGVAGVDPTTVLFPALRTGGVWDGDASGGACGGWQQQNGGTSNPTFDFQWNLRNDKAQSQYSRDLMSSAVLGDIRSKRFLEFCRPLVLRKSDSVVFQVQPTLFRNISDPTHAQLLVSFVGLGYRRVPEEP